MILWSVLDWFCAYCTGESCFEVKTEADSNDVTQHPDEYSCLCNQCGRCFSSSDDLYRHMNIHVSKFVCTDCGECYGNNSKLAVHRRSHSGEKPFECTVCSKRFTASHHLVAHGRIHSGEKPYKCYVCDKAFTESGHLKRHMRVHTGYKPYKCSVCDKSFSDSRSLQRHLSWLYFVQTVLEWISSWNCYISDMTNWLIFRLRPMLSDRYQNETWYGGRPPPRRHCVRWGRSFPPPLKKRGTAPQFSARLLCPNGRPSQLLLSSCLILYRVLYEYSRTADRWSPPVAYKDRRWVFSNFEIPWHFTDSSRHVALPVS